jgi:hypothetical protein
MSEASGELRNSHAVSGDHQTRSLREAADGNGAVRRPQLFVQRLALHKAIILLVLGALGALEECRL